MVNKEIDGAGEMSARLGPFLDGHAGANAVSVRVDVRDGEVVSADRVVSFSGLGGAGRAREQQN